MPLKRLELNNFKSYKGDQTIDFGESPFVCIIGPNGSGKSNLMDAISFVLGVKSAQLRSTQLRDLVYRGRKAAEGMVELGMDVDVPEGTQTQTQEDPDARTASVTAVYEDDEANEWTFRRTVNAGGQSTYYLNRRLASWNVYNAQLEKFNILVKAKNFLVFQGDVEGVASQDSRALAKLIDRVSGSADLAAEYEEAKLEQERASEASNLHHQKKRSIMTEQKHFKEQKAEIQQWEKMRAEKDEMIHRHLLWRLYHITHEITEKTRQVEEANEQLVELRDAVNDNDGQLKQARKELGKAQLEVKKREARLKKAEKALEDKKPELVTVQTQIAHAEKKAANATSLAERVERDEQRQADSLQTLEDGAKAIKDRMDEARERQRQKAEAAGRTLSDADLAQYRALRSQANTLAVQERQQLETARRAHKSARDALASIEDKIQQAERKRSKLRDEVDTLAEREENLEREKDKLKAQIDAAQAERDRIHIKETEINDRLQETMMALIEAGADQRESEREKRLKEALSNLKRIFPGVHGRVIDLCRPTAGKYDMAVTTVLARNLDAVVVDQEKVAIDCIEYMRNQRAGQATFIPLDTIQVKAVPERLRNFTRGARLAIDCIEFDPAVERAMQHACGNSMICDTMDVAKHVCYEKAQEVKAVTLDGTVIHKSGLITGGKSASGRRFDDAHVERLKAAREQYVKQLGDLAKEKQKDKYDEVALQTLAQLEAQAATTQDDLNATRLRLENLRKELEAVDAELARLRPEREQRRAALEAAATAVADLAETVAEAEDGVFAAFCQQIGVENIREYEDVQLKVAREESEAMESFTAQHARVHHQIEFEKAQLASTRERLATLRATVAREEANIARLRTTEAEIEAELESLQEAIDRARERLATANEALEDAAAAVDSLRDSARHKQRALDRALKEVAAWNDEITRAGSDRHAIYRRCRLEEIDLPVISGNLNKVPLDDKKGDDDDDAMDVDDTQDGARPAVVDDFGIEPDFDQLADDDKENADEEFGRELEAEIAKMRATLERVVPNMKALDRLADVETSLATAEAEASDTREQNAKARERFQALKKKRCELFNRAFQHMSRVIDVIYKDLTRRKDFAIGGTAFLTLEESELTRQEPYLSGVRYNTQPPGKRFAEIDALSGGEKTMAALALLFAVHSFHPAPFFVLDEVDAALDPTNVACLARYVRNKASAGVAGGGGDAMRTQFLIISLKSTLYEHADGLVGVYREQVENSSRTLTLNLSEYAD